MRTRLFTDSDTCLRFKNSMQAIKYASLKGIKSYMILKTYNCTDHVSVFNPYLTGTNCVEWFSTESEALKYIGSFL